MVLPISPRLSRPSCNSRTRLYRTLRRPAAALAPFESCCPRSSPAHATLTQSVKAVAPRACELPFAGPVRAEVFHGANTRSVHYHRLLRRPTPLATMGELSAVPSQTVPLRMSIASSAEDLRNGYPATYSLRMWTELRLSYVAGMTISSG